MSVGVEESAGVVHVGGRVGLRPLAIVPIVPLGDATVGHGICGGLEGKFELMDEY
jgi:hypothetical protein